MIRTTIVAILFATLISPSGRAENEDLLAGHPRESYANVENIDAMEKALRASMADKEKYSFSRSWWIWDRLRARYVDGGRKDKNALRILRACATGTR